MFCAMDELLAKINTFLDLHRMEPTIFGIKALNDGHFYGDLKSGKRKFRRKTLGKVDDFMARYKNGKRK